MCDKGGEGVVEGRGKQNLARKGGRERGRGGSRGGLRECKEGMKELEVWTE